MDINKLIQGYKQKLIPDLESQIASEADSKNKEELEKILILFKKNLRSNEIQKRLLSQYSRGEYIEYICLISQLIEFHIKEVVSNLEQLSLLKKKDIKFPKKGNDQTLGMLIEVLSRHIDDSDLLESLRTFNTLRRKVIHKLFSIEFEINTVLEEIRDNFHFNEVYAKIVNPLLTYNTGVSNKINKTRGTYSQTEKIINILEKETGAQFEKIEKRIKI